MSLAGLVREIVQNNPHLTHLILAGFSHNQDRDETAGEIILEVLLNSTICTIQHLDLSYNSSWFKNGDTDREGAIDMVTEIISNQTPCLHVLQLGVNAFSSANTEKLLTKIAECGVLSCLNELYLGGNRNCPGSDFSSDESVRKLAYILAIAPNLTKCDISGQPRNSRKVDVEVEYAEEARMGAIVVKDRWTRQEIHRSETAKQQSHNQMQITLKDEDE